MHPAARERLVGFEDAFGHPVTGIAVFGIVSVSGIASSV